MNANDLLGKAVLMPFMFLISSADSAWTILFPTATYTHLKTQPLEANGEGVNSYIAAVFVRKSTQSTTLWGSAAEDVRFDEWEYSDDDGDNDSIYPIGGGDWPAGETATIELWEEDPIDGGRAYRAGKNFTFTN